MRSEPSRLYSLDCATGDQSNSSAHWISSGSSIVSSDTGMLINFPGSFTLAVNGDELVASLEYNGLAESSARVRLADGLARWNAGYEGLAAADMLRDGLRTDKERVSTKTSLSAE